jgi:hypothetical protein
MFKAQKGLITVFWSVPELTPPNSAFKDFRNCSVRHRPQGVFDAERVKNTGVRQRDRARMAWSVHRRMPFVTVKHVVLNSYDRTK